MPCCRKRPDILRTLLAFLAAAWLGLWGVAAGASAEIEPQRTNLSFSDDACLLDADFKLELSTRLEDIVNHGVPLHFALEFELSQPRWYWLDNVVAATSRTYRLSYHALTRQYRLYSGSLYQSFPTLSEAIAILSRVRSWHVADRGQLKPGETYEAALRLRLDWSQLPKPLQITAVASREWSLGTEWKRWTLTVPTASTQPTVFGASPSGTTTSGEFVSPLPAGRTAAGGQSGLRLPGPSSPALEPR